LEILPGIPEPAQGIIAFLPAPFASAACITNRIVDDSEHQPDFG